MSKKKLLHIKVEELPNGYALNIYKHRYLAFNEVELLELMFVHIGMNHLEYMDKQTIHDLMMACATYPDGTKLPKEIARLEGVIKDLREKINTMQVNTRWHNEQIKHKEDINVKLRKELKALKQEHPKLIRTKSATADVTKPKKDKKRSKGDSVVLAELERQLREKGKIL